MRRSEANDKLNKKRKAKLRVKIKLFATSFYRKKIVGDRKQEKNEMKAVGFFHKLNILNTLTVYIFVHDSPCEMMR